MKASKSLCIPLLVMSAALAAGCSSSGVGLPWIKQGPGNAPGTREPPQAAAPQPEPPQSPPMQPAPARTMDVDPGLIAKQAPSPRTPAEQAAAAAAMAATAPSAYTQATRHGDLVFISGQIALDGKTNQMRGATIEEQTKQVMENLRGILESHRLNMANVVSVTVYLTDLQNFRAMNSVYESYFRGQLPSRSVVEVQRLPRSALVEISAVAGR